MSTDTPADTAAATDLDLVVFGATGFTGQLVVEHLAGRDGDTLRWGIAGRDPAGLAEVAADVGRADLPTVVADAHDRGALDDLVGRTRTVISTVGPYDRHGRDLVAACVAAGTDYVDLTGEPQFVRHTIDTHQSAAEETGARIVHCCGFDSVPSDLGVLVAQDAMRERHGTHATRVHTRVKGARGGASGGTIASLVAVLEAAAADPEVAAVLEDPHSLLPAGMRYGAFTPDRSSASYDPRASSWVAPFVMEVVNARVVRRTNALLGDPWGRDFAYDEGLFTGDGTAGRARATAIAAGLAAARATLSQDVLRRLVTQLLPDAGSGPDAEAREAGYFSMLVHAEHPTDRSKDVRVAVRGDRDPGYGATSGMIGEAGLALAGGESDVDGGIWTPASALGHALVRRLESHAGVTFTVQDDE